MNTYTITINEDMTIEELKEVDALIADVVCAFRCVIWDRLEELGFYSEDYVAGSNPDAEELNDIVKEDY